MKSSSRILSSLTHFLTLDNEILVLWKFLSYFIRDYLIDDLFVNKLMTYSQRIIMGIFPEESNRIMPALLDHYKLIVRPLVATIPSLFVSHRYTSYYLILQE
mmetsp:Transcript_17302/g.31959  ORF Transcript_17302/g.31959 Transcript_17302/m.31959 type:complete len:102 (-) Transcript_17302:144-449(-)